MNKTASERPLNDPGGGDGGGVCTCACLIFLVLFSPTFSLLREKVEQSLLTCLPHSYRFCMALSLCRFESRRFSFQPTELGAVFHLSVLPPVQVPI